MVRRDRSSRQWVGRVADVRAQVASAGDLQATVGFQKDVNILLASVAALDAPGPHVPSTVQAAFGILPTRGSAAKRLRQMRARLRELITPKPATPVERPPRLRTAR
jgi:hypothetical protein